MQLLQFFFSQSRKIFMAVDDSENDSDNTHRQSINSAHSMNLNTTIHQSERKKEKNGIVVPKGIGNRGIRVKCRG